MARNSEKAMTALARLDEEKISHDSLNWSRSGWTTSRTPPKID